MPKASLDGFEMNYEVHEGLLPADTLFMHGNLSSNAWWRPALEVWRKQAKPSYRGRAICAEWRGCGASAAPASESELRPEALAGDYLSLMRRLDLSRVNVVGHSTGGLIALYAMAASPEHFARAVLLDPVTHQGVQFPPEALDAFAQMSRDRAVCEMVMASTVHGVNAQDPFFQSLVDDAFGVAPLVWTGIPKALAAPDPRLPARVPHATFVLHGELDPILPLEGSVALAQALPQGKFHEIKGHGHSTNAEDPALFVQLANERLFPKGDPKGDPS